MINVKTTIIATIKPWNIKNAEKIAQKIKDKYHTEIITNKEELTAEKIKALNPEYIFFPHWSWKIPESIYKQYNCIVFHMTDLPFGRGGSPLQNLIVSGYKQTKISAIKVVKAMDAGPVYLKEELELYGTADEIFMRASKIVFEKMIPKILENNITPAEQQGEITPFKRRKPEESNIENLKTLEQLYDYIRMLDGEGYPKAFIETDQFKVEFSRASLKQDGIITDAKIILKKVHTEQETD